MNLNAVLLSFVMLMPSLAFGNYTARQKITIIDDGKKSESQFYWYVKGRGFRLDVKTNGKLKSYVFNGRTFYLCSQLDSDQVKALADLGSDKGLLNELKKGACQEAPIDFAVRFFMSPYFAVQSPDMTVGYKTNLSMTKPEINLTGKAGKTKGEKCVEFSRKYELKDLKTGESGKYDEVSCHSPAFAWRKVIDMELRKNLLRQPNGRKYHKFLKEDLKKMSGMLLKGSVTKNIKNKISIVTLELKKSKPTNAQVAMPSGYKIYSPTDALFKAKPAKSGKGSSDSTIGDIVNFFLIGGNPAAAVISATGGSKEKK